MRRYNSLRQTYHLSQEDLAGYLGISRSLLAAVETGRRNLPTGASLKLAQLTLNSITTRKSNALPCIALNNLAKEQQAVSLKLLERMQRKIKYYLRVAADRLEEIERKRQLATDAIVMVNDERMNPVLRWVSDDENSWLNLQEAKAKMRMNKYPQKMLLALQVKIAGLQAQLAAVEQMLKDM